MDPKSREVDWPQFVAQGGKAVMRQCPTQRRFPAAGSGDQHERDIVDRQAGSMNEVEVTPQLLELDRDILVKQERETRRRSELSADRGQGA
jgi:hypothetical protein